MKHEVILKIRTGSRLYGLSTEHSDEDFVGIFLNDPSKMYGIFDEPQLFSDGTISKDENNKNTKEAVDCTYYELRKFCKLAVKATPNILEVLYADEENIVECTSVGRELLSLRHLFLSKLVRKTFGGYAVQELKKAKAKGDNFSNKSLSHCGRLIVEGVALLRDNVIAFPLPEADQLMKIKCGQTDREQTISGLEEDLNILEGIETALGEEPNAKAINMFVTKTYVEHISKYLHGLTT